MNKSGFLNGEGVGDLQKNQGSKENDRQKKFEKQFPAFSRTHQSRGRGAPTLQISLE